MDQSNASVANMYSAPSETKLDDDELRSPTFQKALNDVKMSPMGSNRAYIEGSNPLPTYTMKPLNGESRGVPPELEVSSLDLPLGLFVELSNPPRS